MIQIDSEDCPQEVLQDGSPKLPTECPRCGGEWKREYSVSAGKSVCMNDPTHQIFNGDVIYFKVSILGGKLVWNYATHWCAFSRLTIQQMCDQDKLPEFDLPFFPFNVTEEELVSYIKE